MELRVGETYVFRNVHTGVFGERAGDRCDMITLVRLGEISEGNVRLRAGAFIRNRQSARFRQVLSTRLILAASRVSFESALQTPIEIMRFEQPWPHAALNPLDVD